MSKEEHQNQKDTLSAYIDMNNRSISHIMNMINEGICSPRVFEVLSEMQKTNISLTKELKQLENKKYEQ
jgi:hypothetical protein